LNEKEIMTIENRFSAPVYQRLPVTLHKGRGATLWDINGKEYIDCMGGYGVSIVGHCHQRVVDAIKKQCETLLSCHGSFYNEKRAELLNKLMKITPRGLNRIFFCNSGAESVELALKLTLKHRGKKELIAMTQGYHGKTLGALSATWNPKYRKSFKNYLLPNIKFASFGNIEKIEEAITKETAGILIEPIQGESGIHVAPRGFLQDVRRICDENEILLILDEVQTGFGRTGKMWAAEHWKTIPDILCIAKSMAGGIPMGATIAKDEVMNSLNIGEHTSTFGGNPIACAASVATIDVIIKERLPERARNLGEFFMKELLEIKKEMKIIREVRGLGLMIGLELRFDILNIMNKLIERGIIPTYSKKNILRFLPPLVISRTQLKETVDILKTILREEEKKRIR
jgi:acetylornithine/LysW-gamma-L-lysine aminotransferase